MNDITDRRPKVDLGHFKGKSKLMRKWVKKENKRRKKQGLPKLKFTNLAIAHYGASDLTGYLVPGVTPRSNKAADDHVPAMINPGEYYFPTRTWDLRDEDGDLHSPAWYLNAFITVREAYLEALKKDTTGMSDNAEANHMLALDDALHEEEKYGTYVNRLFGSDMIEGK